MRTLLPQNSNKITYSKIAVVLMLFYCYMYTMADVIYKSKLVMIFSFVVAIGFCIVPYLKGKKVNCDKFTVLWSLCLAIALFHNRRLAEGDYSLKMICWFAMIIILILLRNSFSWIHLFVKWIVRFTIIHVIFAWLFKIFPNLFHVFANLYDGTTSLTMLEHYANGYLLGITTHYSTLAIYLGNGMVVLWSLYQIELSQKRKRQFLIGLIVTGFTLAMIGKRGMIIFVIMTIGIFIVFTKARDLKKAVPVVLKYFGIGLLCLVVLIIAAYTIMPQLLMTIGRFMDGSAGADITSGRFRMWMLALTLFVKNPIFGIGWFGYREVYMTAWYHGSLFQQLDTHNVYLQLLCETGIFGFAIFMIVILRTLALTLRDLRKCIIGTNILYDESYKYVLSVSCILQILFALYCLTGNPLYDPQNFIVYFLSIAAAYSTHSMMGRSLK